MAHQEDKPELCLANMAAAGAIRPPRGR